MLSLSKHLSRFVFMSESTLAVEMLRQAQHDVQESVESLPKQLQIDLSVLKLPPADSTTHCMAYVTPGFCLAGLLTVVRITLVLFDS